ncbi:MAG: O-antigen ligase family protein [Neptuniibacter sp.]
MVVLNVRSDNKLATISAFVFVSLAYATIYFSPAIPHGGQGPLLFLFFISIPLAFSKKCFQHLDKKFFFAFIFVFLAAIPLAIKSGEGEALDAPSRFLIIAIVFLALYRIPIDGKWVLRSAMLACLIAFIVSCHEVLITNAPRTNLGIGILESAYTLSMLVFICLSALIIERDKFWKLLTIISIIAGTIALIQTGTRGAWLATVITGILFIKLIATKQNNRQISFGIIIALFFVSLGYTSSDTLRKRVNSTVKEIQSYGEFKRMRATSTNLRLIYWEHAWEGFKQSPLTGLSYKDNALLKQHFADKYKLRMTGAKDGRSSSHNEILNAMVQKGLLGLMAIIIIYLIPLKHFAKKLKSTNQTVRFYAISGICTISAIAVSGLTEAPLMHTSVSVTYGMLMILLYHSIRNQELADQKESSCSRSS